MSGFSDDHEIGMQVKAILRQLDNQPLAPSPYLKTRVLARWQEEENKRRANAVWWRRYALGVASLATAALVCLVIFHKGKTQPFQMMAHQPVAVRVDLKDIKKETVARATVELPKGVSFFSQRYPTVHGQRALDLQITNVAVLNRPLPIVIKAEETGIKEVHVRFFNKEDRLVGEKVVIIKFNSEDQKRSNRIKAREVMSS